MPFRAWKMLADAGKFDVVHIIATPFRQMLPARWIYNPKPVQQTVHLLRASFHVYPCRRMLSSVSDTTNLYDARSTTTQHAPGTSVTAGHVATLMCAQYYLRGFCLTLSHTYRLGVVKEHRKRSFASPPGFTLTPRIKAATKDVTGERRNRRRRQSWFVAGIPPVIFYCATVRHDRTVPRREAVVSGCGAGIS